MKMKGIFTQLLFYALLSWSVSTGAQDGIIISEIADPADDYHGRFIEIYNAGPVLVDFDADTFYLSRQSNGGTSWGEVQLTGTVAAGETFVIGGSSFESIYGFPPEQVTGILTGNGDDAYFLFRNGDHGDGMLHDIFGVIDTDGTGEPWEYADSRAVRVEGIIAQQTTWIIDEWEITPADVADTDPGIHHDSPIGDTIPQDGYYLEVKNDTVEAGQILEVIIAVNELTVTDNIISYQFDIGFDHSVLEYSGCDITGTIAEGGEIAVNPDIPGELSISYMNFAPLTGAGPILKIQFSTLALDTTDISISNAWLNNVPVENLANGRMIIREAIPPTAAITYNDTVNRFADTLVITATFSEAMDMVPDVHINLSGATSLTNAVMTRLSSTVYTYDYPIPKADGDVCVRLSNGNDLWGNQVDSVPTTGEMFSIIKFTPGDVDDDGNILAYDAAITLQYSVGLDPLPEMDPLPWENWRDSTANVDGAGIVSAYDAGLILQYSAGIITSFTGEVTKSQSGADVSVEIVGNEIVFYSFGDLVGLDINVTDVNRILGFPVVVQDERYMSAYNINGMIYNIGLCTAVTPEDGMAIMRIPFYKTGSVIFNMLINGEERFITMDIVTGVIDPEETDIYIYPNPAVDKIYISTGDNFNNDGYQLTVVNQSGVTVFASVIQDSLLEIDLSDWPDKGLYFLQVKDKMDQILVTRKMIFQ
jgi:hypothetical protein